MRGRFSILLVFVLVLSVVPLASVAANGGGTVSGTVHLDGAGLAGVEVFIADGLGGRYTCTDEFGYFEFADVDEFFFSATGPAVELDCSNPRFVDDDGIPLVIALGGGGQAPATIDFVVERLPRDHPGFFNQLRTALYNCYGGNGAATADILADFDATHRKLSDDVAEIYRLYAEILGVIAGVVCPQEPVTVIGFWEEDSPEGQALLAEFAAFTADKGVEVFYESYGGIDGLHERITGLDRPDVIVVSQPWFLLDVADELADLSSFVEAEELREDFGDYLIDSTTLDGSVLGAPITAMIKTLVWYKPAAFDTAGYEIPETFADLVTLSDQIVADPETGSPWCNYIGSGAATGWVGTDWIEDLLLSAESGAVYDQWVGHSVPFTDARVETAFERYQQMIDTPGFVFDRSNMLDVFFAENVWPLYDGDCLMHRQATFLRNFIPAEIADEFSTFKFPSVDPELSEAAIGWADYVAALDDGSGTESLLQFMLSEEFGETALAATGGWLSPNTGFDESVYQDDLVASWAGIVREAIEADLFRPDGSDLMPGEVGAGSFWAGIRDLVAGAKTLPQVLADIDTSWPN